MTTRKERRDAERTKDEAHTKNLIRAIGSTEQLIETIIEFGNLPPNVKAELMEKRARIYAQLDKGYIELSLKILETIAQKKADRKAKRQTAKQATTMNSVDKIQEEAVAHNNSDDNT